MDHREAVDGVIAFFRNSVDATENRMGRPLFEALPLAFSGDAVGGHCEAYKNFEHVGPRLLFVYISNIHTLHTFSNSFIVKFSLQFTLLLHLCAYLHKFMHVKGVRR